jgi:dipeptidyl aminopeptidase/acylaminoacyl peptidase
MEIPDLFRQATMGDVAISPDGSSLLYTLTHGSFPEPSQNSQIHLAFMDGTVDRPMTRTKDGANRDPRWHPSGEFFGFTSTRGGNGRQVYLMWPDGGEARQVTDAAGGVFAWGWSDDGSRLAYLAGSGADRQIWIMDGSRRGEPAAAHSPPHAHLHLRVAQERPTRSSSWPRTAGTRRIIAAAGRDSRPDPSSGAMSSRTSSPCIPPTSGAWRRKPVQVSG